MTKPTPHELYYQAVEEVGDLEDRSAIGKRYRELLAEHGHLVPRPACTCNQPRGEHAPECPRHDDADRRLPYGWLPGERPAPAGQQMALSVWQPWAWLLVAGRKDTENRRWRTTHRGRLWIHASLRFDQAAYDALIAEGINLPPTEALPRGALVGAVELLGCVRDSQSPWAVPGQWHWQMGRHWMLPQPIPMRGKQGLFPITPLPTEDR